MRILLRINGLSQADWQQRLMAYIMSRQTGSTSLNRLFIHSASLICVYLLQNFHVVIQTVQESTEMTRTFCGAQLSVLAHVSLIDLGSEHVAEIA
jgi:hypothetical protein